MSAGEIGLIVGAVISGAMGFLLGVCVGRDIAVEVTIRIGLEEDCEKQDGREA